MIHFKNYIPNSLTLINLFAGCLAIVFAFIGKIDFVPYFVAICLFADFLDGMIARALKVQSPIGSDLDSLADMVSFGVLPGVILFLLIDAKMGSIMMEHQMMNFTAFAGFSVTIFSALRLAIFNNDESQKDEFIGLATPASTLFIVGILLLEKHTNINLLPMSYVAISAIISFLLVSKIQMFSFKLSSFTWKDASWQYVFVLISLASIIAFKSASISFIIIFYVFLNIIKNLIEKKDKVV